MAVIAIAAFMAAVFMSIASYRHYKALQQRLEVMTVRLQVAQDYQKQIEQKKRLVARVNSFLDKTKSMGLEQRQWSIYEVDFNELVSYYEMGQIVDQCTNSDTFFFKPVFLQVQTQWGAEQYKTEQEGETDTTPIISQEGDVRLNLKGAFYAKQP